MQHPWNAENNEFRHSFQTNFSKFYILLCFFAGIIGTSAAAIGNLSAGFIMKKMKMAPTMAAAFYVASLAITIVGLIVLMLISCPDVDFAGVTQETKLVGQRKWFWTQLTFAILRKWSQTQLTL